MTRPIRDQFYGHRVVLLADPFGYTWDVFTVTEEMSVEEMHRRLDAMTAGPAGGKPGAGARLEGEVHPIRSGFQRVTPYLVAPDGEALLRFAKEALGAEETLRSFGSEGGIHGEIRIGDSMLMIGGGVPGREFKGEPHTTALHVYVEDTDAVYERALAAGASSIAAPQDHDYAERGASVKDFAGNFWYIATHKGASFVPKGLRSVNAYLHPLRAEPVIAFLKRAFDAEEIARYPSPDGVIHHAEVRVGDSVVEMGEAHGPYQPMQPRFCLYVPGADAAYRRALAAGAKPVQEPADQPYGDRNTAVLYAFGNTWYVATHLREERS